MNRVLSRGRLMIAALAVCVLSASVRAQEAAPPATLLPPDTLAVVIVRDFPQLVEKWKTHPLKRAWDDPQIVRFTEPGRKQMDFTEFDEQSRERMGLTMSEIIELQRGATIVAITGVRDPAAAEIVPDGEFLDYVFISDIGDRGDDIRRAQLRSLEFEKRETEAEGDRMHEEIEPLDGAEIHLEWRVTADNRKLDDSAWAVAGKYFIEGTRHDLVRQTVRRIAANGREESLADNEAYRRVAGRLNEADVQVFFNLQRIVELGTEFLQKQHQAQLAEAGREPNPFEMTPVRVMQALGADVLRSGYATMSLDHAVSDLQFGLEYSERKGLLNVLAYQREPFPRPAFIPAEALQVSSNSFSIPQIWTTAKQVFAEINPLLAGMMVQQLQQFGQQMQVDIENDLIAPLGSELLSISTKRQPVVGLEGGALFSDDLYIISMNDAQRFQNALNAIIQQAGAAEMIQKRDYLGTIIHSVPLPMEAAPAPDGPPSLNYAFFDRYLLVGVGGAAPLEAVLVTRNRGGESFWDRADIRRILADLPPDTVGFTWTDMAAMMNVVAETFATLQQMQGAQEDQIVNPAAIPDAAVIKDYFGPVISDVQIEDNAMRVRARLQHPPQVR